jgi:hypothetical protein
MALLGGGGNVKMWNLVGKGESLGAYFGRVIFFLIS